MDHIVRAEVLSDASTPIAAAVVTHAEDTTAHGHAFMELVVVAGGAAVHTSSAGSAHVRRGSVVALRPGEWHIYEHCDRLEIVNVYIGLELFTRELSWIADDPTLGSVLRPPRRGDVGLATGATTVDNDALGRLLGWGAELMGPATSSSRDRTMRVGHLVMILGEIAALLARDVSASDVPVTAHPSVIRAARLLQQHLDVAWTLSSLADTVSLAPAYLVRLFGRHLGLPPMAYLNRIRAERLGVLLIETDIPISTIATTVGWPDPTTVSRRFRPFFGMTPAQYRSAFRRPQDR